MKTVTFTGMEDLDVLAESIQRAIATMPAEARLVVQKGALNIKTDAWRRASGLAHAPLYPRSITYDSYETPWGSWAVIGPDKAKPQGALGNILEFGTTKNAPIPHLAPAAEAEQPRFEKAVEALAIKALGPVFT